MRTHRLIALVACTLLAISTVVTLPSVLGGSPAAGATAEGAGHAPAVTTTEPVHVGAFARLTPDEAAAARPPALRQVRDYFYVVALTQHLAQQKAAVYAADLVAAEQAAAQQAAQQQAAAQQAAQQASSPSSSNSSSGGSRSSGGGGAGGSWAAIRQCESGGNYSDNTGNGYYGAYQFSASTWHSLGYSGLPSDASPSVQDQAAQQLQARSGWGQWPVCSVRAGA